MYLNKKYLNDKVIGKVVKVELNYSDHRIIKLKVHSKFLGFYFTKVIKLKKCNMCGGVLVYMEKPIEKPEICKECAEILKLDIVPSNSKKLKKYYELIN